jgi:hypothetical protein
MLVLQPRGGALAVGVLRWHTNAGDRLTWLVRAGFDEGRSVPSALSASDFVARRNEPLIDGVAASSAELAAYQPLVALVELNDRSLGAPLAVPMRCDTVWTQGGVALVWRGDIAIADIGERDRAVVTLEAPRARRTLGERLGDKARAQLSFALTSHDADAGPTDADELALERLALADEAPQPSLALEVYAAIAAEIAEQREPLGQVLERRGLDQHAWALEERAWLERMAQAAMEGDAALAAEWGDHFVAAQDALGKREEQDAMIHEYAAVTAELERADDPMVVLGRWGLSLAEWLRLDRHWSRCAASDARVREELERMLAVERARVAESEDT